MARCKPYSEFTREAKPLDPDHPNDCVWESPKALFTPDGLHRCKKYPESYPGGKAINESRRNLDVLRIALRLKPRS